MTARPMDAIDTMKLPQRAAQTTGTETTSYGGHCKTYRNMGTGKMRVAKLRVGILRIEVRASTPLVSYFRTIPSPFIPNLHILLRTGLNVPYHP